MDTQTSVARRHDIDWLRVLLFALLIWYHYYMVVRFRIGEHAPGLWITDQISSVMHQWRLPALFMISGMGTAFAFRRRSWRQYLRERIIRLLIPLLFVVVVLNWGFRHPMAKAQAFMSSFPFPSVDVFQHMWFVYILLIYSVALIPLFVHVRNHPNGGIVQSVRSMITLGRGYGLLIVPPLLLALAGILFKPWMAGSAGFWWETPWFALFFLFGYFAIIAGREYSRELVANRLVLTLVTPLLTLIFVRMHAVEPAPLFIGGGWITAGYPPFSVHATLWTIFLACHAWFWCLLIFTWGYRFLNQPSRMLTYLNKAVYPAYVVHMNAMWVVILLLAFVSLDRSYASFFIGIPLEAAICLAMFELARRGKWAGVLFGIKKPRSTNDFVQRSVRFDVFTALGVMALMGGSALYYFYVL